MIQITPQMRILVAVEAVDGRKGIDSLARLCQERPQTDPFSGCLLIFRSRHGTAIRILVYDGQGSWLAQKRLSKGRFRWWPEGRSTREVARSLAAHQLHWRGRRPRGIWAPATASSAGRPRCGAAISANGTALPSLIWGDQADEGLSTGSFFSPSGVVLKWGPNAPLDTTALSSSSTPTRKPYATYPLQCRTS